MCVNVCQRTAASVYYVCRVTVRMTRMLTTKSQHELEEETDKVEDQR